MRLRVALVSFALLGLVVGALHVAAAKSAGEGAFLTDFADNTAALVTQVEGNRLVALRYAKHFRTEPSSVLIYFRNELSVTKLEQTVELTVYHIDASLSIVSETKEFKAGTKVFANRFGVPILEYGTGNPLATSLPSVVAPAPADGTVGKPGDTLGATVQSPAQPGTQPTAPAAVGDSTATLGTPPAPPSAATPGQPGEMVAGSIQATSLPGLGGASQGAGSGGRSSLSSWLLPIGVGGIVAALAGGGGGTPAGGGNGGGPKPTIPEPAGMAVLGSGLIAFCGLLYRRRKHSGRQA